MALSLLKKHSAEAVHDVRDVLNAVAQDCLNDLAVANQPGSLDLYSCSRVHFHIRLFIAAKWK